MPPNLPFTKGGTYSPSFCKRGAREEIECGAVAYGLVNFTDGIVASIRHKQRETIAGDAVWRIETRRCANTICTALCTTTGERCNYTRRHHDFTDFIVADLAYIKVCAIAGDAVCPIEARRRSYAIRTTS